MLNPILYLIIKKYFMVMLATSVIAFVSFIVLSYNLIRFSFIKKSQDDQENLTQIAGDDLITTQLDLARAYIETNQKQSAFAILQSVAKNGNNLQKKEANELLEYL